MDKISPAESAVMEVLWRKHPQRAEDIVAANCFGLLSGWYLEAGRIRKEQEEFFRSAENADTFLLGSYFTPSYSRSVFNALHAISLIPYTYQLQGPLLDNLGFLPEETEELTPRTTRKSVRPSFFTI